jgi:hypothetical protein
LFLSLCVLPACQAGAASAASIFQTNDTVAFLGAADVVAAQQSGHLESLLAIACRGQDVRFRNLAWEGDTVFEQPRDFGFPTLLSTAQKSAATIIVVQYGRVEALNGKTTEFAPAYRKLLDALAAQSKRIILVTPVPFEKGGDLLPDLSKRNSQLATNAEVIRNVAHERGLVLVDLFRELADTRGLTSDGLQLTPHGYAIVAGAFATQLGLRDLVNRAGGPDDTGKWKNPAFEQVRKEVVAKNRLWYDYSRPQNWAFLGGDRISQPSSRDHRNPQVRWFPAEMEKFLPLIAAAEMRIDHATDNVATR